MRLEGKVAIVTGGARGIGRATSLLFADNGARVVVADVDETSGREVVEEIRARSGEALFLKVDVRDFEACLSMAEETVKRFGRIDVLINNAGIVIDRTLLKLTPEEFHKVIEVNVMGVFNCTKAVAPHMVERGRGAIVNASSVVALYGKTSGRPAMWPPSVPL